MVEHTVVFDAIKNALANISKVNYYDANRETRVKCDASHNGLGATLEQQTDEGSWVPISFASRYLNIQEKKYSSNELELLAVVLEVDRYKQNYLGKLFTIATDHKALTSALDGKKSNKTYQTRLTRWVDRLLPYQIKIVHIPGRDMGIVDYLSGDPYNDPWPESELDERFVVATINSFHEALYCMSSRLESTGSLNRNENVLECSRRNVAKQSSLSGCYDNQNGQKLTMFGRNGKKKLLRASKQLNSSSQRKQITFSSFRPSKQSCQETAKTIQQSVNKIQKKKQTQKRRYQKTSIAHMTAGRMHHRNGEMMTERREFWTRSGIAHSRTNCPKRRRLRKHCNAQKKNFAEARETERLG